jgi:hypothetical protein
MGVRRAQAVDYGEVGCSIGRVRSGLFVRDEAAGQNALRGSSPNR